MEEKLKCIGEVKELALSSFSPDQFEKLELLLEKLLFQYDKTSLNLAIRINPMSLYKVSYTINSEGEKEEGYTYLYGKDLTENQIIELYNIGII